MAGFFGLFNYNKEGPGIPKDAPKKKTFVVFFETFLRNMWKLISVDAVYILMSILIIPIGLANVGLANVTRNLSRDKHSFMLSDYFETIKKNWKQGLSVGIINTVIYALMFFAGRYYIELMKVSEDIKPAIGLGVCLAGFIIFSVMNFYIYTLIITFNFSLGKLYSNSFKFVFLNLKNNFLCGISLLLVYGINIALIIVLPASFTVQALAIEIIIAILWLPAFRFLMIQYAAFPGIIKFVINPYYENHPGEDIELRRNLGLDIPELEDEEDENGEEEEDAEETEE